MEPADLSANVPRAIPEFGLPTRGAAYRLRPGGYAIVTNGAGQIVVVITGSGMHLPGGGQEDGETPAQAAVRETYEECGLRIRVGALVVTADELVFAAGEGADGGTADGTNPVPHAGPERRADDGLPAGVHWRKRCSFFAATVQSADSRAPAEHMWTWMDLEDAGRLLTHGSARWALEQARQKAGGPFGTGLGEG